MGSVAAGLGFGLGVVAILMRGTYGNTGLTALFGTFQQ